MQEYVSVTEVAKKWGISKRQVLYYCNAERIPGTARVGSYFIIPADAKKPADARIKSGTYAKEKPVEPVLADYAKMFENLLEDKALVWQMLDMFPMPIEVFAPDATTIFLNQAFREFNNISDANVGVGKYNLLEDPVCQEIYGHENLKRMFRGESVIWTDMPTPIQTLIERGVTTEKPFEGACMDLVSCPVWNKDVLAFVVCVFIIKNVYQGQPDVAKAQEYIEQHWRRAFDQDEVAKALHISSKQLYNLFKQHTEITPFDYYKLCKVEHIKKQLTHRTESIKEVFADCGEDSRGTFAKVFKDIAGMSPKEYREHTK
jgi:AraC-like DNA-binding protein